MQAIVLSDTKALMLKSYILGETLYLASDIAGFWLVDQSKTYSNTSVKKIIKLCT